MATTARTESSGDFERYRGWLRILAATQMPRGLVRRLDASDIVQETLARAWERRDQLRGESDEEAMAWLRTILARTLGNALRDIHRQRRDPRREVTLERSLDDASRHTARWLETEDSTPSGRAVRLELADRVADALDALPEDQREAVLLRHFAGLPLADIAARLERTSGAVALLIHRGLTTLRSRLQTGIE
jgi:RNA polymerase sigma-70 factor (ECF subfamily)